MSDPGAVKVVEVVNSDVTAPRVEAQEVYELWDEKNN